MDYFNDVFAAFLGLDRVIGSLLSMGGSQSFRIKKIGTQKKSVQATSEIIYTLEHDKT